MGFSRRLARCVAVALAASAALSAANAQAEARKFALGMFHYNVQYVAGGVIGFGGASSERSPEQIEDLIVTESLEPVLDLFLAHPTWGQDIEMQGYMLEVIGARHPGVLDKLRRLVASGQIEVDSFHYSDQLFIAYPPLDWTRSQELNARTFAALTMPRGGSVFCQEGQAGVGLAGAMKDHGYELLVWPPNLWKEQHSTLSPAPLYAFGDVHMIVGQDAITNAGDDTIEAKWTFLDDGELLATGDANPYLVSSFRRSSEAVRAYELELETLAAEGFAIVPVSRYVAALKAARVPASAPPPLLDGTWQPQSTDSTHKWTGGRGLWLKDERDNDVRTLAAIAHRELVVAETLARNAQLESAAELSSAWRLLALGQVSDATGINPIRGEIEYGLSHLTESLRIARDVITRAKEALGFAGAAVDVDSQSGAVVASVGRASAGRSVAQGPIEAIVDAGPRAVQATWAEIEPDHFVFSIVLGPSEERSASVRFVGAAGADLVYTPALTSTVTSVPRSAFDFDRFTLPLHDGLIGLGPDTFVVKDLAFVHVGARITPASGDVVFADDTLPASEPATWRFHVLKRSPAAAAAFAQGLNVFPRFSR